MEQNVYKKEVFYVETVSVNSFKELLKGRGRAQEEIDKFDQSWNALINFNFNPAIELLNKAKEILQKKINSVYANTEDKTPFILDGYALLTEIANLKVELENAKLMKENAEQSSKYYSELLGNEFNAEGRKEMKAMLKKASDELEISEQKIAEITSELEVLENLDSDISDPSYILSILNKNKKTIMEYVVSHGCDEIDIEGDLHKVKNYAESSLERYEELRVGLDELKNTIMDFARREKVVIVGSDRVIQPDNIEEMRIESKVNKDDVVTNLKENSKVEKEIPEIKPAKEDKKIKIEEPKINVQVPINQEIASPVVEKPIVEEKNEAEITYSELLAKLHELNPNVKIVKNAPLFSLFSSSANNEISIDCNIQDLVLPYGFYIDGDKITNKDNVSENKVLNVLVKVTIKKNIAEEVQSVLNAIPNEEPVSMGIPLGTPEVKVEVSENVIEEKEEKIEISSILTAEVEQTAKVLLFGKSIVNVAKSYGDDLGKSVIELGMGASVNAIRDKILGLNTTLLVSDNLANAEELLNKSLNHWLNIPDDVEGGIA